MKHHCERRKLIASDMTELAQPFEKSVGSRNTAGVTSASPRAAQPIQGVAQRLDIGSHGIAQLALGPDRGEEHVVGWTTLE